MGPGRSSSRLRVLAASCGVAFAATAAMVHAQEAPPARDPADLEDVDPSRLTTDKLVARASGYVREMEQWLTESFRLLEQSLSAGDVNAANTRNEAITVIKGLVKLSEQNFVNMQQKAAEGDRKRVDNEYVKILMAHAKVQEYYAQVRSAGSVGLTDLDLSSVERRLVYSGELPVAEDLPALFRQTFDVFSTTPTEPVHASPYF